jgi:hypothetical protein
MSFQFDKECQVIDTGNNNFRGKVHSGWTPPYRENIPYGGYIATFGIRALNIIFPDKKPSSISIRFVNVAK